MVNFTVSFNFIQLYIVKVMLNIAISITGESVEENANLVIRLLIRRPECLGPALRGEGEGLLRAIIEANKMSERIADRRKVNILLFLFS